MDKAFLEELGLTVHEADGVVEAQLELTSGQAVNPLTRQFINRANFTVIGDRLIAIDPPELVGTPPINLAHITRASALEDLLLKSLNESIFQVSRRSAELSALGLAPRTDPATMQLTAELDVGDYHFNIGTDRLGNFRVMRALKGNDELTATAAHVFELSEFRERGALEGYLLALFGETQPPQPTVKRRVLGRDDVVTQPGVQSPVVPQVEPTMRFQEVVDAFGAEALVPARSQVEVLIELRVGTDTYRFAAARVAGRTFRGLIAGKNGKVWADRFEIGDFPGIKPLLSTVLSVSADEIEVVT